MKKQGNQYASLCVKLDVASCGHTKKEAVGGLKNAIEAYPEFMISEKREKEIYRPVPMDALKDFLFTPGNKLPVYYGMSLRDKIKFHHDYKK